jgi:hypothetical protein
MRIRPLAFSAFLAVAGAGAAAFVVPSDAEASVSIAVSFEALVKDADAVAIITPEESRSLWEDGRIYTYTRVKIEQGVAGELGGDTWVRTMGGVVGKVGQLVDGEPVFTTGKSSLVFFHRLKATSTYEVSARAQGQYPVVRDDVKNVRRVIRSGNAGVLFPPKPGAANAESSQSTGQVQTQSVFTSDPAKIRLAQEVMHEKSVDDVTREIAVAWKRLHPPPPQAK